MEVAALLLSIVALVVALTAAWYARRQAVSTDAMLKIETDRRSHEATGAALDREAAAAAKLADLEVRFAMLGDGLLLIANHGPARAEKIRIELVRPLGDGEMPELLNRPRPFDLRADETKRIRFRVGRGHAQGVVCLAHWNDDSGPRSKQFDVDLMTT